MSRQVGDDTSSPEPSRPSALANVFRGLTSSKSTKSPPLRSSSSAAALPQTDFSHATSTSGNRALSSNQKEAFEMLKHGTLSDRISAAEALKFAVTEFPLNPVVEIWSAGHDLVDASNPVAARLAGWELLTECAKHTASTDLERKEFFQTLSAPSNPEDFHLQLAALVDLTHGGRTLAGFDYDLLPLLTSWLKQKYDAARVSRKSSAPSRSSRAHGHGRLISGEEKNFAQLFSFITDVIKFSFNSATDTAITNLISQLLFICMNTNVQEDLKSCIGVVDVIVTFGTIPREKLNECVRVLSSIYSMVPTLVKDSWHTLANLCRSHNGQAIVRSLLDALRNLTARTIQDKDTIREVRGALAVLRKLTTKSTDKGYPTVPYALLVDGISNTADLTDAPKVLLNILQIISCLFDKGEGQVHRTVLDEDWSSSLAVAAVCARKSCLDSDDPRSLIIKEDPSAEAANKELQVLISRLDGLLKQKTGDYVPRQSIINFLTDVHPLLPDATVKTILEYFQELRCCSPSDLSWEENLDLVLHAFLGNRSRSSPTRVSAFSTIMDAYEVVDLVGDSGEQTFIPKLARRVLAGVSEEADIPVLEVIMQLIVSVVETCDMELFDHIVDTLRDTVIKDCLQSPVATSSLGGAEPLRRVDSRDVVLEKTPANVVTMAFVKMFTSVMNTHSEKSVKLYNALTTIARSSHCEIDARLTSMKLLFRLRANWENRIFVATQLESMSLASVLYRTDAAMAKRMADEATQTLRQSRSEHGALSRAARGMSFGAGQGPEKTPASRANSYALNLSRSSQGYLQRWKLPDPEALPDNVPKSISPVLVSAGPSSSQDSDQDEEGSDLVVTPESTAAFNISAWLDVILGILQGSDWETYSFVLVHLPSQLSNHALFQNSLGQVQSLRRLLCDQIRTNGFQEPPHASGLRRADVAICLYHSLTMILSYHDHFQKSEEDDIVRTFVHGISTWERSAKCCIHALSICCHELPLSTSKLLVQMLNQMAVIITQPHVSVHILEFLACLSRLHHIYVNFREEEYRIVFAICFRYLEYAREKHNAMRPVSSEVSTPTSVPASAVEGPSPLAEDLPPYVHALAYHVILFWFLAMKLPDRASHVGYIVKKLFSDAYGTGQTADEQAVTSIDFLQRITYADVDESAEDPSFTEDNYGEILSKRWIVGNSIVTIKQATTTGWAQVVKRQPSGSSSYMIRETYRPPPAHQDENHLDVARDGEASANTILPSHLLLQLMSPIPQSFDSARPIPLPDDDATTRALKVFDRYSTVDGHKVGVIYIAEGQTTEREILSNVSGSPDYVQFLENLGTVTRLKGATFNTQGLDREYDTDGQFTFCWRDRVTEIVFHVTTQMPNLPGDEQYANKKRHIGNDFVNIIFNDSGLPFHFDTFPSQFNFVNIVISPASPSSFVASRERAIKAKSGDKQSQKQPFYRVQVLSKPGFPDISPASETKMVSLTALPGFVRLLALNASVFSLVWHNHEGGEHISSWTGRLREIRRLRDRYAPKYALAAGSAAAHVTPGTSLPTASPSPPPGVAGTGVGQLNLPHSGGDSGASSRPSSSTVRDSFNSLRRTSVATFFTSATEQPSHRSSLAGGSLASMETDMAAPNGGGAGYAVVDSVDFSKWA